MSQFRQKVLILVRVFLIILRGPLISSKNSGLTQLIDKVHSETNSATVYFVGFDKEFLCEFLKTHPKTPASIFDDINSNNDYKNITNAILVVHDLEKPHWRNQKVLEILIGRIQVRKFVIISTGDLDNLKAQFAFFFENKFTRILGIADNITYALLPYADRQIEKLLSHRDHLQLPQPLSDLNGFTFNTSIQSDIPRTFPYTDKFGRLQIGGSFGQLLATFFRHHNATYKDIFPKNSSKFNVSAVIEATSENKIDISFNAFYQEVVDSSYPVKVIEWVMMVPINGYLNPHEYFKRPFQPSAWIFIALALVYMTLIQVLLNKLCQKPLKVWQSFSQTFLSMLMLPAVSSPQRRLYLQIFLFSFIIGNIYVIFFTSFLTAFIQIKQFDNLNDLVENNFPILISTYDLVHVSKPGAYPEDVNKLFVAVEHRTYHEELHSMKNTSYAFMLGSDRRDFLINMQASLMKPLFRRAPQVLNYYVVSYILPHHSPFKEILNDFVMRVQETGLMAKWDDDVIRQAPLGGFEIDVDWRQEGEEELHVPLTLRHFEFAWTCAVVGWIVAFLVFLTERMVFARLEVEI